jgi:hypothetical protein
MVQPSTPLAASIPKRQRRNTFDLDSPSLEPHLTPTAEDVDGKREEMEFRWVP